MIKVLFMALAIVVSMTIGAQAADWVSTTSNAGAIGSAAVDQNITFNGAPITDNAYRQYPMMIQPPVSNNPPYMGPWKPGWNILEDWKIFPDTITLKEAKNLYKGGITSVVQLFNDVKYESATGMCLKILDQKDIPAGYNPKFRGYIFMKGYGTTASAYALAASLTIEAGADAFILLKKDVNYRSTNDQGGIGASLGVGNISGNSAISAGISGYYGWGGQEVESSNVVVVGILDLLKKK